MNEIVQKEEGVLREIAKEVPVDEIKSKKIETVIKRMKKALDSQDDGVAIAAPQIGESLRIFVVSKKIFEILEEEKKQKQKRNKLEKNEAQVDETENPTKNDFRDLVFINPEILKISKNKISMEEGCLSVRWLYGKVMRAEKTLVKAYDESGKLFTLGGSGILSQVFQHEIDHLNGILFTDKAKSLKDMPPATEK